MQRAPAYGATVVNTHIGSHRGGGRAGGVARLAVAVATVLADSPNGVRLVLENSAGGGDSIGGTLEELASILEAVPSSARDQLAFCLDTAHLWGAGYDISTTRGATAVLDRFDELIGLERLALVHLNDSRSLRGSRGDRHEHIGAGRIGAPGLAAFLRDPRLPGRTALVMETPGVDEGFDAVNMRRSWLLYAGAEQLPILPPRAFRTSRASTRTGPRTGSGRLRRATRPSATELAG
jgi:deoxyribonuclease-4